MSIDKRLNEMEPKDTPLLVMGYMLLGMIMLLSIDAKADDEDNQVFIGQAGDDVIIEANQEGYENRIDLDLGIIKSDSSNNIYRSLQDGFDNDIKFSLDGQSNEIAILQEGNNFYIGFSSVWGEGHDQGGDIDGDSNTLKLWQKCSWASCNESKIEFHVEGDSNDVIVAQGWFLDVNSNNGNSRGLMMVTNQEEILYD